MTPDPQILLAANRLIYQYGDDAEEYAATQLWAARQASNETEAAKWLSLIAALKEVRALRKSV